MLKHSKYPLGKNPENLTDYQKSSLDQIQKVYPKLFRGPMSVDHIMEICQNSNLFGKGCFPFAISAEGDDFVYDTYTENIYFVRLDDPHRRKQICTGMDHFFQLLNQSVQNE